MKRIIVITALILSSLGAGAFDFDGINLNDTYNKVTREISKRGYTYNHERNCLQGNCHGVDIYLSINYIDVSKQGMLGQLIVEIPSEEGKETEMFNNVAAIMNVIYHQVAGTQRNDDGVAYLVDSDGTQLVLGTKSGFITLTYNTPYYSKSK